VKAVDAALTSLATRLYLLQLGWISLRQLADVDGESSTPGVLFYRDLALMTEAMYCTRKGRHKEIAAMVTSQAQTQSGERKTLRYSYDIRASASIYLAS
jgi:hypothetical protein